MFMCYSLRKQQHCEPKHQSICRKQEIWESKWKTFLGQCPFNLIFKEDLVSSVHFIRFWEREKGEVREDVDAN